MTSIQDELNNIAYSETSNSSFTGSTSITYTGANVTLPAGVYIISGRASYGNARLVAVGLATSSTSFAATCLSYSEATLFYPGLLRATTIVKLTASTTFYVWAAHQSSGTSEKALIQYIRLK